MTQDQVDSNIRTAFKVLGTVVGVAGASGFLPASVVTYFNTNSSEIVSGAVAVVGLGSVLWGWYKSSQAHVVQGVTTQTPPSPTIPPAAAVSVIAALLLCGVMFSQYGCASTSLTGNSTTGNLALKVGNSTVQITQTDVSAAAYVSQDVISLGLPYALKQYPSIKPDLTAAQEALSAFLGTPTVNLSQLQTFLDTSFNSSNAGWEGLANAGLPDVVTIAQQAISLLEGKVSDQVLVADILTLLKGVNNGLAAGLGVPASATTPTAAPTPVPAPVVQANITV